MSGAKVRDWHEAIPFARAVYARDGGAAGCCFHVVLDDFNIEREFIDHSVEFARARGHPECLALAELLERMSLTQIGRLAREWNR